MLTKATKDEKLKKSKRFPIRKTPELINILLKDRTTNKNIIWGTDSYVGMGKDFMPQSQMKEKWISNGGNRLVQPRMKKHIETQSIRTKENAEVFTPIWMVEKQNSLVESEFQSLSLDDYISKIWLEITCGEAPYMCTRYDAVSGKSIDLLKRVGFIDKKLQRISREIDNHNEWLNYATKAIKSSYGYELQGDSLLIARENILYTFIDYYSDKFKKTPTVDLLKDIATIISYNVFQMDGLKYIIPYSEETEIHYKDLQLSLFEDNSELEEIEVIKEGSKVLIKDWINNKKIEFEQITLGGNNMKFDVVIGNPPYQENDNGKRDDGAANASASPLYHLFVEGAESISKMQCLIIPARWLSGAGKGLSTFTKKMTEENKLRHFSYFTNSREIFPDNEIKGGVCYFLRENNYKGKSKVEVHSGETIEKTERFLDENNAGVFIPYAHLSTLLSKVSKEINILENNMQLIVSGRKPFGLSTDFFKDTKKYGLPSVQMSRQREDDIEIFGLENGRRVIRFVPSNYPVPKGKGMIELYKVFLPYAYGSGEFGEVVPEMIIGNPKEICTETFLCIGKFETELESKNLIKYIKSKFFRGIVGVLKTTQHSTRTYKLVPLQDFTPNSDIDWGVSISNIDKQLYNKYNFSQEEIDFIENNVREMK